MDKLSTLPQNELTNEDFLQGEKFTVESDPFLLVGAGYLYIKTKTGLLLRFKLNSCQEHVLRIVLKLRKEGKPARLWILKARQMGVSTVTEAIIYSLTSQLGQRNSLIMADQEDKSNYLFEMSKLYHSQLAETDPHLTPQLKKSNAKSLEFEGIHSQILIETARNVASARAFTYQYVHLSEVAFFPDLKGVLSGLMQSVPQHFDTLLIGETTANGINEFYHEWRRAIEGKSDWTPVFLPWFWMEEYKRPLVNGNMYPIDSIVFSAEYSQRMFLAEERNLEETHGLSKEQLNWRRWSIVNNCQGDINVFKQEYPSTWEEAFIMSGDMYFDKTGLAKQRYSKPIMVGELFEVNLKYEFRKLDYGRIKCYYLPKPSEEYIVTGDGAEGIPGRDSASLLVLNKRLNRTEAIVRGAVTPEDLAQMAINLGYWYNTALIAIENKGYGYMVNQLVRAKYGNVYRRSDKTDDYGWNTNSVTRPSMLATLNEEIRKCSTELISQELIDECRTFIVNPDNGKAEASPGEQDGLVICRAIAGMVRNEHPFTGVFLNAGAGVSPFNEQQRTNYGFWSRRNKDRRH